MGGSGVLVAKVGDGVVGGEAVDELGVAGHEVAVELPVDDVKVVFAHDVMGGRRG